MNKSASPKRMEFYKEIGHTICLARTEKNLTQRFFANKLGISKRTIQLMEKGEITFDAYNLIFICTYLKIKIQL